MKNSYKHSPGLIEYCMGLRIIAGKAAIIALSFLLYLVLFLNPVKAQGPRVPVLSDSLLNNESQGAIDSSILKYEPPQLEEMIALIKKAYDLYGQIKNILEPPKTLDDVYNLILEVREDIINEIDEVVAEQQKRDVDALLDEFNDYLGNPKEARLDLLVHASYSAKSQIEGIIKDESPRSAYLVAKAYNILIPLRAIILKYYGDREIDIKEELEYALNYNLILLGPPPIDPTLPISVVPGQHDYRNMGKLTLAYLEDSIKKEMYEEVTQIVWQSNEEIKKILNAGYPENYTVLIKNDQRERGGNSVLYLKADKKGQVLRNAQMHQPSSNLFTWRPLFSRYNEFRLEHVYSGKCLEGRSDGSVALSDCSNNATQKWEFWFFAHTFYPAGGPNKLCFSIRNKNVKKYLSFSKDGMIKLEDVLHMHPSGGSEQLFQGVHQILLLDLLKGGDMPKPEPKPDLVVEYVFWDVPAGVDKGTYEIRCRVRNQGESTANRATVEFFAEANHQTPAKTWTDCTLKSGEMKFYSFRQRYTTGVHTVKWRVDPKNGIAESIEDNNMITQSLDLSPEGPKPDLSVGNLKAMPVSGKPGHYDLSCRVQNIGWSQADNAIVELFTEQSNTNSEKQWTVTLGPNGYQNFTCRVVYTPGKHTYVWFVDRTNRISEKIRGNNVSSGSLTVPDQPH